MDKMTLPGIGRTLAAVIGMMVLCLVMPATAQVDPVPEKPVKIGVLANQGKSQCRTMWQPTADYLSAHVANHKFFIVPLGFEEVLSAGKNRTVDFMVANPGMYIILEYAGVANRIATFQQDTPQGPFPLFGGVIFCRADRRDIQVLDDLKGKRFVAVETNSLGGWQAAWREFNSVGIVPQRDFQSLPFVGSHDAAVLEVLKGNADAGTVRTSTLEQMAHRGAISLDQIRVLHPVKDISGYPLLCSTRLYPEWPFAQLYGTSNQLAHDVAAALLAMPRNDPAASAAEGAGWTIPQNYESVHDAFRELAIPPYANTGSVNLYKFLHKHWPIVLSGAATLIVVSSLLLWTIRLNRILKEEATAQKQTLKALRDSEQRMLGITEAGGVFIWEVDESGHFSFVSENVLKLLGCTAEFLYTKTPFDYMDAEDIERIMPWFQQQILEHSPFASLEYRMTRQTGASVWLSASGKPRYDQHGVFKGFRGAAFDITQRKNTEEALRASEECFVEAFMSSPDGFIISRLSDGRIIEMNESVTEILGYTRNEMLGRTSMELGIWLDEQDRMNFVRRLQREGRIRHFYVPQRHKSGHILYVSISAQAIPVGRDLHVLATFRDITERMQMEDATREFNQRLQQITAQVPGMVYQFKLRPDGTMCFPYVSAAIQEYFKVGPEEVREDASILFAALHPGDLPGIVASIETSAQHLTPWQYEYRTVASDGQERWLHGSSVPQMEEDGSILWHGFISDITESKRAEEYLRSIMATIQAGVLISDCGTGLIVDANPFAVSLTGYEPDFLRGQPWTHFMWPRKTDRPMSEGHVDAHAMKDCHLLTAGQDVLHVRVAQARVKAGAVEYLVQSFVDISDIEHLLAEQAVNINLAKRILEVINADPPRHELLRRGARLFLGMESIPCKAAGGDHCFARTLEMRQGMSEARTVISISDQSGHEVNCILRSILTDLIHHTLLSGTDRRSLESRVGQLNDAICSLDFFQEDDFVTAMVAEIGHETHILRYVSCGHPPLLLIRGKQVIMLPRNNAVEHNLPLGCIPEAAFTAGAFPLEVGDRLLFYTDGLTEMPVRQKQTRIGNKQLCQIVTEIIAEHPDASVTEITRKLLAIVSELSGEDVIPGVRNTAADDITLVFLEMESDDEGQERTLLPEHNDDVSAFIAEMTETISREWTAVGFENPEFKVRLVLEEAILNAWIHGNKNKPGLPIRVRWRHRNDFIIDILNEGEGFVPEDVPDPRTIRRRFESTGRGLFMIRSVSTSVRWLAKGRHISVAFASKIHPDAVHQAGLTYRFPGWSH